DIHAEVSRTPSPLHDPPSVTITLDVDPVDTVPQQIVSPASTGDEVILFPSATEVFDLFSSSGKSPKFDFVKLICHQCRRRFFSAGGLENHLYAVHDIHFDSPGDIPPHADLASVPLTLPEELVASCTNTGPPSCAPFSKIVPATTWATVAAKPPLSSSQPWAGQRLSSPTPSSSSPQVLAAKTHKTISFSKKPDEVEHAVLLPLRPPPRKRRKNFPCLHCDFTFRTLKSRDEHHVIHLLEDEFNALHGLACNISATDFDDFQLPRARSSKHAQKAPTDGDIKKQSGSAVSASRSARPLLPTPDSEVEQVKPHPRAKKTDKDRHIPKRSSTSSSRETVVPAPIHSGDLPGPTLSCHFCDRDGFPTRKALRYHLFRLHQIPMGRLEARRAASPAPSAANLLTSTSSTSPTSGPFPLVREDDTLFVDFPLRGEVVCPEPGCVHSFVCKSWSSAVWSAKKHLRIHHTLPRVQTCLRCGICQSVISKPVQNHSCLQSLELYVPAVHCQWKCEPCLITFPSETSLRNHLAGHTRANLRNEAPKLSLPAPSTKKRKRRKRGSQLPSDINEPSTVSDPAAVLAQPVLQEEFQLCSDEVAPGPLSHFVDQLDRFASDQFPPITFGSFEDLVEDITQAAISHLFPDGPPTGGPSSTSSTTNIDDPATCQRLYTRNRRRAVREIVGTVSEKCKIPLGDLTQFFADSWTGGSSDPSFFDSISSEGRVDVLDNDFTPTEVWSTLKKAENTAPGPDRLTYHHLRTVDPGARILSKLFNICLKFRRVPCLWKRSTTILIPKGGDPELLSNWRPIALSNTAYKTFAKCLSARLSTWCERFGVLSPCQKGFMPFDGVLEHNFVLQHSIERARSAKRDICIAWLDVTNAFGALPHCAIFNALRCNGVGETLVRLVEDIYTDSSTSILTEEGVSPFIPISSGVKQGCPLSGLLFNITIDPVLREIQGTCDSHRILAFADDLCLVANSPDELQVDLNRIQLLLGKLHLLLNPGKSFSYHLHGATPVGVLNTEFFLGANRLTPLVEGEFHRFLGKPVGFNPVPDYSSMNDLGELGVKLARSKLSPWQRLDALKSFFFPCLQFPMRTAQFPKEDWARVDKVLRKDIKDTLNLPVEASNEYLYGQRRLGCCGIPIAAEESDMNLVDTAFKLLTSRDDICAREAFASLVSTVHKRLRREPDDDSLSAFLSGDVEGEFATTSNRYSNTWTVARVASRRLGITWTFEDSVPSISFADLTLKPNSRRKILHSIRDRLRTARSSTLLRKKNQGKAIEVVSLSPASSHFISNGAYTRFADWRFIHRARLNLVPLNGAKPWLQDVDKRCRRCGFQQESLAHVINHCPSFSHAWQLRHNAIVDRLHKALLNRGEVLSANTAVLGTSIRPDLVFKKGREIFLIDVTCPFENRTRVFDSARARKLAHYEPLLPLYHAQGLTPHVVPILVGALGSWDPQNDSFLRRFMSRSYLNTFRRLCVSDTIKWSRDIYVEFLTGHKQYSTSADLLTEPTDLADIYSPSESQFVSPV
ncbi:retrovirus-related Pol polyprotein from type-2 retrotransposable element R2DM, partial [Caerostris darwini]